MLKNMFLPEFYHQNAEKCKKMSPKARRLFPIICNVLCLRP